jgi:hypothetical protein
MAADVKLRQIAAELRRIVVDPGDGAADLLRHDAKIAIGLLDRDEIDRDVMRARIDEHLGRIAVIFRRTAEPCAAIKTKMGALLRFVR